MRTEHGSYPAPAPTKTARFKKDFPESAGQTFSPVRSKAGDMRIDACIFPVGPRSDEPSPSRAEVIQVKQKDRVGCQDTDSVESAVPRSKRKKGFFGAFNYTEDALRVIGRFFKDGHAIIIPLTVQEIMDEHIAKKLT